MVMASGTTEKRTRAIFGYDGPAQRIALDDNILIDLLADEAKRPVPTGSRQKSRPLP